MLYLAEVRKQKSFMGGSKAELRLLACERNDKSWVGVPNKDDTVQADVPATIGDGVLVVVNLGNNRQIQGNIELASDRLVGILQGFSRLIDKTREQEEEIETWKQSLTYQSQELNRREVEIEARFEQLEQMEQELARLEQQRQAIESSKSEMAQVKADFEKKRQELESAWDHLRGEQRRLEERLQEVAPSGAVLDGGKAEAIRGLFSRLGENHLPTDHLQDHLHQLDQLLQAHRSQIEATSHRLHEMKQTLEARQGQLGHQEQDIHQARQSLQEKQHSFDEARIQLQAQRQILESKEEVLQLLLSSIQDREELEESVTKMSMGLEDIDPDQKIDLATLEALPLGELQEIVENLKGDLEKLVGFVNAQEEELTMQCQAVSELQSQIAQAGEYDRIELETQLVDEQETRRMLDETLVGQRRNLREREALFRQHLQVLKRRQGVVDTEVERTVDLAPLLNQIQDQRQRQEEERERLEAQIHKIREAIQQMDQLWLQQNQDVEADRLALAAKEEDKQQLQLEMAELAAQVQLWEEMLPAWTEQLQAKQTHLQEVQAFWHQIADARQNQQTALGEMQQVLGDLIA